MRRRPLIAWFVLSLPMLAMAVPAYAQIVRPQPRPERPTRGLFGGGIGDTSQQLVLNVSFMGGYDDDLLAEATGSGPLGPTVAAPRNGQFGGGSASLSYSVDRERVRGGLQAATSARYYPSLNNPLLFTYSAGGQLGFTLASRTTLTTSMSVGVQPFHALVFYGGAFDATTPPGEPADLGATTVERTYQSMQSGVQLSHGVTSRLSVGVGYAYYGNDAWSESGNGRYAAQSGNANVGYALTKGVSLRLGYSMTDSRSGATGPASPHRGNQFDGGIDFNRALSISRRSSLGFSTGLAGVSDLNNDVRYYGVGHVNFGYEIGRSWSLSAGYRRSVDFHQVFLEPVFLDSANAGVGGHIGRRLQVSLGASGGRGTVGIVAADATRYTAGTGSVSARLALTRTLGLGVSYAYYQYVFDNGAALPPGVRPEMNRQSVQASLDMWAPLLMRARRANAAR